MQKKARAFTQIHKITYSILNEYGLAAHKTVYNVNFGRISFAIMTLLNVLFELILCCYQTNISITFFTECDLK